jgi:hypothetical protein
MTLVPVTAQDEAMRTQLLTKTILPKWIQRCGLDCVAAWNDTFAPALGIRASEE